MISKYKNNGLVWIDLTSPSEEEIAYILDEYQISENIRQEIESSGKDHKTAIENGTLFTILRLPKSKQEENVDKVIIIKNRDYVITIHDQPIDSISQFSSDLELDMAIPTESNIKNQELLLAHLLRKMFVGLHDKILLKDMKINSLLNNNQILKKRYLFHFVFNLILLALLILIVTIWR
ncbi:MAG: hypothetical protein EOM85_00395 [Candidatus Moranbacteria bacterium]|nr:hypothetical protein [Candidatus Moranbacteria bacterium]